MTNGSVAQPATPWRARLTAFVEGGAVERFIIAVIILNAVTLGLETSSTVMATAAPLIQSLDSIALTIFVVEITLRIAGRGWAFFRDPWSVFDFLVVTVALVPVTAEFAVLRALRVLRVLRLMSMVPSMRRVVSALLAAIPGLSSIMLVLLLLFYVFAVMATTIFAQDFPEWFGSIGRSMYTLFQVMTLESWSMGIVRPILEKFPYAWLFFIPFILIATFTMLNLFIAIIVSAMQSQTEVEEEKIVAAVEHASDNASATAHQEYKALRVELREIRRLLEEKERQT